MKTFFTYFLGAAILIVVLILGISVFKRLDAEDTGEESDRKDQPTTHPYTYHEVNEKGEAIATIPGQLIVYPDDPNRLVFVVFTESDRNTIYTFDKKAGGGTWVQGPYEGVFKANEGRPWRFSGTSQVEMKGDLVYPETFIFVPQG